MLEEKTKLQNQADTLSERLEAMLHDKFPPRSGINFDADTPIDKTLNMLQSIIAVSSSLGTSRVLTISGGQDCTTLVKRKPARQRIYCSCEHHLLEEVLHDNTAPRSGTNIDADTAIDKDLNMPQSVVMVSVPACLTC